MLQYIRELTAGWLALLVLGLFCVPFVFWGVNLYFGDPPNPAVARVGERELARDAFRTATDRYRREIGARELSPGIRDAALERMIDGGLILEYTNRRMQVGDRRLGEEIERMFGGEGLDLEEYQEWLAARRLTSAAFETQVRQELLSRQLQDSITQSIFLLDDELRRLARAELQERDLAYIRISVEEDAADVPDMDAIRAYYDEHPEEYTLPERVRATYLELTIEKVAGQLEVNEEELRSFYAGRSSDYDVEEKRKLTTIHIPMPDDDPDREAAGLLMQRVLARAEAGESLEALVEEEDTDAAEEESGEEEAASDAESDGEDETAATDAESAVQDDAREAGNDAEDTEEAVEPPGPDSDKERELTGRMELITRDDVTREELPPDQAEALFALREEGALSPVLEDSAGVWILRLDEIREGRVSTFENSRADAERDYREVEAERRFIEQAERLGTLTFESPAALEPAARALGLEVQETGPFSLHEGATGTLGMESAVRDAAFSEAVLEAGENSPLLELDDDRVVVLRVQERIPESLQPLEEVEERIVEALQRAAGMDAVRARGETALERLRTGANRQEVATELGLEWEEREGATRENRELLQAALREAFRMPEPDAEPVYSGHPLGNGDYLLVALLAVRKVEDDTAIPQEKLDELSARLSRVRHLFEWREFLQRVRELHEVEVYREQVDKVWSDLES